MLSRAKPAAGRHLGWQMPRSLAAPLSSSSADCCSSSSSSSSPEQTINAPIVFGCQHTGQCSSILIQVFREVRTTWVNHTQSAAGDGIEAELHTIVCITIGIIIIDASSAHRTRLGCPPSCWLLSGQLRRAYTSSLTATAVPKSPSGTHSSAHSHAFGKAFDSSPSISWHKGHPQAPAPRCYISAPNVRVNVPCVHSACRSFFVLAASLLVSKR